MNAEPVAELVDRIHSADAPKAVVYVVGGGTEVFPMLLARGGGSATLLSARIPYDPNDFRTVLGCDPGKFVDARAARGLAMAAFRQAQTIRGDLRADQVFGVGATSKLATGSGERSGRSHEIHAALQTAEETRTWSIVLPEGNDRPWEERVNALLLINMIAMGKGVHGSIPLEYLGRSIASEAIESEVASAHDCRHPGLPALLVGQSPWVAFDLLPEGSGELEADGPRLLMPGSFRPLHPGHVAMAETASRLTGFPCAYELSLFHPEKPPIDYLAIRSRLNGFEGQRGRLYLTNAPTYLEKARLFPGSTFVVGHDTALRIVDPRFYGGIKGRDMMLGELESLGFRLLVFGRVDASGQFREFSAAEFERPVSDFLQRVATPVPEDVFRVDLSSTQVREQSNHDFA